MSRLTRKWKLHIEPTLEWILRGGSPGFVPRESIGIEEMSRRHPHFAHDEDGALLHELPNAQAKRPRAITGNVGCLAELVARGLTSSGKDRWWHELLCSDDGPSTSVSVCVHAGRVLHQDGAVIDRKNRLVARVSGLGFDSTIPENPLTRKRLAPPKKVHGTLAVLSGFGSHNYYHWLIDIVPKLSVLQDMGIPIDFFFVPQKYAFQRESVRSLGIDPRKIIAAHRRSHVAADRILAVNWEGLSVTPSRLQSIHSGLASLIADAPALLRPRRLYISRSGSSVRRIINESELFAKLRAYDFEFLCLEGISMREQIAAFQSADVIVAPHGAGLANLCFCRPGTRVMEITTPFRVLSLFTRLANAANLEFHLHIAEAKDISRLHGDTAVGDSNMWVDVAEVERALQPLVALDAAATIRTVPSQAGRGPYRAAG